MDETLIKTLKRVVIAGAVVLALGTSLLVWLLLQRARTPIAADATPTTLALPADARIGQALVAGNQLVLLGEVDKERRFLAVVDLASGKRRYLLWLVPDAP